MASIGEMLWYMANSSKIGDFVDMVLSDMDGKTYGEAASLLKFPAQSVEFLRNIVSSITREAEIQKKLRKNKDVTDFFEKMYAAADAHKVAKSAVLLMVYLERITDLYENKECEDYRLEFATDLALLVLPELLKNIEEEYPELRRTSNAIS